MADKKIIYADHSATTKVRAEVVDSMIKVLQDDFGNPSSIHQYGQRAKQYLNEARENIAQAINATENQIFFTSGGTESNNIAILGVAKLLEEAQLKNKEKHIIATKIEHPAVKEPLEHLETKGWRISWLKVNKEGFIDLEELKSIISPKTLLVSIIHANNEIGTIQDLKKISTICKEKNVLLHTDAVQSFCKIPINVQDIAVDLMSLSSHKIYGPKGTGALFVKDTKQLMSLFFGGGQEKKIRPGTENLPGIVGFGLAARLLKDEMNENAIKLRKLQIKLMSGIETIQGVILTGVRLESVKENIPVEKYLYRLPGHVSVCCENVEGENLVLQASLKGILASSASACSSKDGVNRPASIEPSHVLVACAIPAEYVKGSLRLTLGKENTEEDVDCIVESIKSIKS